jgi:hypothetical protein
MSVMKSLQEALDDGVVFEIAPDTLRPSDVDPAMWPILQAINESGWAWSRYCCEGHWEEDGQEWTSDPYVQITCHKRDLVPFVQALTDAIDHAGARGPGVGAMFTVSACSPNWWACSFHYLGSDTADAKAREATRGQRILADFARRLARPRATGP